MLAAALVSLLPAVSAHIALWHPSGYGFDAKNNDSICAAKPLWERPFAGKDGWWMHGDLDFPPEEGKVMELPAGGVFHGQVACHKKLSDYGKYTGGRDDKMACDPPTADTAGAIHAHDAAGAKPWETKDVKGCGLGIAYEADAHKVKPEDFTMISVNYHCPWYRDVDFEIPKGLPPCPEGGCTCTWVWIHSPGGGRAEMYMLAYKCNVTGETGTQPLPPPAVARKCPFDKNNCTVGAKQPHYWWQKEGNNNFQGQMDPPFYNGDYGFMNGAQTDLWETSDPSKWDNTTWAPIPPVKGGWTPDTTKTMSIPTQFATASGSPSSTSASSSTPVSSAESSSSSSSSSSAANSSTTNNGTSTASPSGGGASSAIPPGESNPTSTNGSVTPGEPSSTTNGTSNGIHTGTDSGAAPSGTSTSSGVPSHNLVATSSGAPPKQTGKKKCKNSRRRRRSRF